MKRILICADHGLALIYFLHSDILPTLLAQGVEIVLLTEDDACEAIAQRFGRPGMVVEGLRVDECKKYHDTYHFSRQYWLHLLRWVGGSRRVNVNAIDGNYRLSIAGIPAEGLRILPFIRLMIWLMRRSRLARRMVTTAQNAFRPGLYADLFDKYRPDLVVASSPGWRWDRYLLREAAARGIPTASVIMGWDNPSSYRLNGAPVDYINCWSEIQKEELVLGADWNPERVAITGVPSYDGYFRREWLIERGEYFRQHGLEPQRKLLAYACSFETFSPNFPNIAAIAGLVDSDKLDEPCQLLIRLHPNHFRPGSRFEEEANRVRAFIREMPHVHLVEPVSLSKDLGHYSGEDMPEKSSMLAHSDVFLTVYSTMVVEAAIHDRPIVSVTIDTPGGWNLPGVYSLPLSAIGDWPTHLRFRQAGAGRVAVDKDEIRRLVNFYLRDPQADHPARAKFVRDECTFTDGSAGKRTGEYLLGLLGRSQKMIYDQSVMRNLR
jgi:hypothetical protein